VKSLVRPSLGPLEEQVLRIVCNSGKATVRDVVLTLEYRYAYTTIMTTMDRLFQKALLRRETRNKAYLYTPVLTQCQLETQVARDLMTAFLGCWQDAPGLLASALVDALAAYNATLLDKVADEIHNRRLVRSNGESGRTAFADTQRASYSWPLGNA
jgi:predicted transcriptional regulator